MAQVAVPRIAWHAGGKAVVHRGASLTYAELDARSNGIAARLQELEIGRGDIVAVAMTRGLDWVATMIGIFKVRAAYLPLDPQHPPARLAGLIRQAGCRLVLGNADSDAVSRTVTRSLDAGAVAWLDVGTVPERAAPVGMDLFDPGNAEELAYVLFTSGSTGAPKGVMIRQGGLTNHLAAKLKFLDIGPGDRVAQAAAATFDPSFWQLFCPLLVCGQACILDDETVREPKSLFAEMAAAEVTLFDTVPSHLQLLLEQTDMSAASLPTLRCLILGGEALPPGLCRTWLARFPNVPIVNYYGPTECSDGVTHEWITTPPGHDVVRMSIGRPIDNLAVYIIDPAASDIVACGAGEVGELAVAGVGVGVGYIHDPERTARVFVQNPFSSDPAFARFYRTGDLARFLPDGRLEFIGRRDHQVKIRGHRVELGEIEARLLAHEAVTGCAVMVRARNAGAHMLMSRESPTRGDAVEHQMLVAYLVTTADLTVDDLRSYLGEYLPPYMIPERFVMLDSLPLNANGKLDRRALPEPGSVRPRLNVPYVIPKPGLEEKIASAWARVLVLDRVGARDGFLALGGDSLTALPAINLIAAETGLTVTFTQMLSLTVSELANTLATHEGKPSHHARPPRLTLGRHRTGPLPLSPSQERYWIRVQKDPQYTTDHLASALRLRGKLDVSALTRSLAEVVRRHEALRTTFHRGPDGEAFQLIHPTAAFALERRDLRGLPAHEQERRVREACLHEAAQPFDFSRGPLFRAILLELDDEQHVLGLVMHHIISDGWSWGVLTRELGTLYDAFVAGRSSPLRDLPAGYADYALWTREWLASTDAERELAYWKHHLRGAPTRLELPLDRPRPPVQSFTAAVFQQQFPRSFAHQIDSLGQAMRATPFMTFSTAFALLLGRMTGSDEVLFGSAIANRTETVTEDLIGCFQNGLLVRVDLSKDPTFLAVLKRVRQSTLDAYEHQRLATETIIEKVFGAGAIPQVVFALQNAPDEDLRLQGIEIEKIDTGFRKIKYDFVLEIHPMAAGYEADWSYRTDLFDEGTIARMASEFEAILKAAVEQGRPS